jgi:hypothetical protein
VMCTFLGSDVTGGGCGARRIFKDEKSCRRSSN